MRFLRTLNVGDKFRPAHPEQVSLNNRPMANRLYKVAKVYPQKPYIYVCEGAKGDGIYTLRPGTPVLLPREPAPTPDEVMAFLSSPKKKRVACYRMLWDGKTSLKNIVSPQAAMVVKLVWLTGKKELTFKEMCAAVEGGIRTIKTRQRGRVLVNCYVRTLAECGILEEVLAEPKKSRKVVEANLQEAEYGSNEE